MEETFATVLARLMADRNLSARGLSLKSGLKPTAVRDILNGRSKQPRGETLARLAFGLEIPLVSLVPARDQQKFFTDLVYTKENLSRQRSARDTFGESALAAGHIVVGNLEATDFSGANLAGASFMGARLAGANLSRTNLSFTNFTGCDLRGVNFQDAVFHNTIFVQADLRGSNLAGVDLSQAVFVDEGHSDRDNPPKTS